MKAKITAEERALEIFQEFHKSHGHKKMTKTLEIILYFISIFCNTKDSLKEKNKFMN